MHLSINLLGCLRYDGDDHYIWEDFGKTDLRYRPEICPKKEYFVTYEAICENEDRGVFETPNILWDYKILVEINFVDKYQMKQI